MQEAKSFNIWMVVTGTLLAILGIMCMFWSSASLVVLTLIVGIGFVVAGITQLVVYIRYHQLMGFSGWVLAEAIIDLVLGLMFTFSPVLLSNVIPWVIAIFIMAAGITQIVASIPAHSASAPGWAGIIILGILTIIFACLMIAYPGILAIFIGIYAVCMGISMIVTGTTFGKLFE